MAKVGGSWILALAISTFPAIAQEWRLEESRDQMTDAHMISVRADSTIPLEPGTAERAIFTVGCNDNTTFAGFVFGSHQFPNTVMQYRIDKQPPENFFSQDQKSYFLIGSPAIQFIREILSGKFLHVRTNVFFGPPVDGRFATEGLEIALRPIKAACGWE